jgi:formylglycine-generating enzyme required for sulfatase activity
VCIDKYEGPNQLSATPQGNVSFADAQRYCGGKGKRVCTAAEWQWACSGLEGYAYAYGNTFDEQACNTAGVKMLSSSGARSRCVSRFGASDMTGNVFEWVSAANKPMLMGGPSSKCQSVSPGGDGSAQPYTGYRCCKSN